MEKKLEFVILHEGKPKIHGMHAKLVMNDRIPLQNVVRFLSNFYLLMILVVNANFLRRIRELALFLSFNYH